MMMSGYAVIGAASWSSSIGYASFQALPCSGSLSSHAYSHRTTVVDCCYMKFLSSSLKEKASALLCVSGKLHLFTTVLHPLVMTENQALRHKRLGLRLLATRNTPQPVD
jgi:hypothetical protein